MKLRNKQTGEIGLVHCDATMFSNKIGVFIDNNHIDLRNPCKVYNSLAELNAEWEDYEEPEEHYFISNCGEVKAEKGHSLHRDERIKIGNDFNSKEEADEAVEKLKAFKRLKDKGFRFEGIKQDYTRFFNQQKPMRIGRKYLQFNKAEDEDWMKENWKDLDLLFGGEE